MYFFLPFIMINVLYNLLAFTGLQECIFDTQMATEIMTSPSGTNGGLSSTAFFNGVNNWDVCVTRDDVEGNFRG